LIADVACREKPKRQCCVDHNITTALPAIIALCFGVNVATLVLVY
jgi:hypothetical protein